MTHRIIYMSDQYMNEYNSSVIAKIIFYSVNQIDAYEDLKPIKGGEEELFSYMANVVVWSITESFEELLSYVANDIENKWPNTLVVIKRNERNSRTQIYLKEYINQL